MAGLDPATSTGKAHAPRSNTHRGLRIGMAGSSPAMTAVGWSPLASLTGPSPQPSPRERGEGVGNGERERYSVTITLPNTRRASSLARPSVKASRGWTESITGVRPAAILASD